MSTNRARYLRVALLWVPAVAVLGVGVWYACGGQFSNGLELDVKSAYSRIKVTRQNNTRTLWFVRDNGDEVVESVVDLKKPHDLLVEYTRFMFLSYLFRPQPEQVLIVGLGGGSMVHFLEHYDPKVKVDVVEIDPMIVKIADKYFGVRSGGNVDIITKDAFAYLRTTDKQYDVIYMDAFLKPSNATDKTGVPLRLKTIKFYKDVQKKLTAGGVVVFNLNPHPALDDDLKTIGAAFAQTYVFNLSYGGVVVVASTAAQRREPAALLTDATALDNRFKTSYPFRKMVLRLD